MSAITPYQRMAAKYIEAGKGVAFQYDVAWYLAHGFVFSRPDYFVMGRPVVSSATEAQMMDPDFKFFSCECDCWYVHAMAGNVVRAFDVMPWKMPFIAFHRIGREGKGLTIASEARMRNLFGCGYIDNF